MKIILTLLIAAVGYLIAKKIKLPVPAMIGSMLAVGIFNVFFDRAFMPASIKVFTQGIAGIFIGIQIEKEFFQNIKYYLKPLALLMLMLTINTFIVGIINAQISKLDILTSLLASIAGGTTDVSLISLDLGADASSVAIMQTFRLVSALSIFPSWINFLTKNDVTTQKNTINSIKSTLSGTSQYFKLILTIIIAFVASYIGKITNIPAGSLIFSAVTIMIINLTTDWIYVVRDVKTLSQLLAGSLIGVTFTKNTFANLPTLLIPIVTLFISYVIINYLFSIFCVKLKWLDRKTALFSSCPAGASEMALIAAESGADLPAIGLIQVSRLIYSISVMPQLVILFMSMLK